MPDAMFRSFFAALNDLPSTNKTYFAELAGGVHTLPINEVASKVDYSYEKIKRRYEEGFVDGGGLRRVRAIIHLIANDDLRRFLRNRHFNYYPQSVEKSTASWLVDEKTLQFYGYDDFAEIESLFIDSNVPIFNIKTMVLKHYLKN